MPKYTPKQIYTAARTLLPELDEARRRQAESLLARAERGQATDLDLLDLLSREEATRQRLRALLGGTDRLLYAPPAGDVHPPEARKFICPVPGHDYVRRIQKAGEDPGVCPEHGLPLIPFSEKKGGR